MHEIPTLRAAMRKPWLQAFLSMDIVRAFYGMMGLDPAVHVAVQRTFVDVTLQTRRQLEAQLTKGTAPPTFEWQCEYVERSLGHEVTQHLIWWLVYLLKVEVRDHLPLWDWMHVLRLCQRQSAEMWRALGLPQEISTEARARVAHSAEMKNYHARCAELDAQPLSDWDLHLYASQLLDFDDDFEGSGYNPDTYIVGTVQAYQDYQFWDWLLKVTTEAQQAQFRENALRIAQEEELTSVKDLVAPSKLRIGL